MAIDRPDFVDGELVAAPEVATVPRDEDGKVVRADWPPPDADFEPPSDADAEGRAIVAEVNGETESPGSFDELPANAQAVFVNEAGYDNAVENNAKVANYLGPEKSAAMDAAYKKLPDDARDVVARLNSHWGKMDEAELFDYYRQLARWLPLSSAGAMVAYVEKFVLTEE